MEISGRIKSISDIQTFDSGFRKREVVITTEEQYPQHILIEFAGDRTDIINSFNVGEDVRVSVNIRGREWVNPQGETKYFNSITGWRIEKLIPVSSGMGQEQHGSAPYARVPLENKIATADSCGFESQPPIGNFTSLQKR